MIFNFSTGSIYLAIGDLVHLINIPIILYVVKKCSRFFDYFCFFHQIFMTYYYIIVHYLNENGKGNASYDNYNSGFFVAYYVFR